MMMVVHATDCVIAVHRHRDHVARRLRADRLVAAQPAQLRGRDEVLPGGRVRHRLPALRHRRWSTAPPAASSRYAGDRRQGAATAVARRRCSSSACYFILVALAFKIAAVPFHMWAPDAYEGAPTPVTAFMAAGVKAAAFGGSCACFGTAFGEPGAGLRRHRLGVDARRCSRSLTMTLGNLAALRQDNIKRMLAYSSIAHAGYLLVGVVRRWARRRRARSRPCSSTWSPTPSRPSARSAWWPGSAPRRRAAAARRLGGPRRARTPALALAMTIFLLSLGGFPPTAGFFGKFYLFRAALEEPAALLAGRHRRAQQRGQRLLLPARRHRDVLPRAVRPLSPTDSVSTRAGLIITAVAVVLLGLFPSAVVDWAHPATTAATTAVAAVAK